MTIVDKIEGYHSRLQKAKQLVWDHKVHPVRQDESKWLVEGSDQDYYTVEDGQCECYDFNTPNGYKWCKHLLSIELQKLMDAGEITHEDIIDDVDTSDLEDKDTPIEGQQSLNIDELEKEYKEVMES